MIIIVILLSFCYVNPNFKIGEITICGTTHNTLVVLILVIVFWLVNKMDDKENFGYYHAMTFCPDKYKHCASRLQGGQYCKTNHECASAVCRTIYPMKMDAEGNSLGLCQGVLTQGSVPRGGMANTDHNSGC